MGFVVILLRSVVLDAYSTATPKLLVANMANLDSRTVLSMSVAQSSVFAEVPRISVEKAVKTVLDLAVTSLSLPARALVLPEDLNLNGFTHVNFAFAFFDPTSFEIAPMDSNSASLYRRFTSLKESYSGLQTWISVGGWSFTDPGPTRQAFSDMASSSANRQKFISSIKSFMNTYGFDGLDIDWEYPGADDRGGAQADSANFVTLVKELKESFGSKGLTVTLPTSYWYLQHFDVKGMQDHVDWFNLMAYDLHGTWDADSQFVGPYIAPHTNLSEIDQGLGLLWRAGVESSKVVLGQGWYGRSFTLKDPSCDKPNGVCQFNSGAEAGPCSGTSGILDYQEIEDVINKYNPEVVWDKDAGVKWITWNNDQWISYDDDDTFAQKKSFADDRCLGGLMVWAIDQKDQSSANNLVSGVSDDQQNNAKQSSADQAAKLSCYTTDCDTDCKMGTNKVAQMNGQPGKLSTKDRCPSGQHRNLCCNDGTKTGKCQWRGYRETELVTDTSSHSGSKDQTCNGGLQSFCCSDFKAPPTKSNLLSKAGDAAKDAAEAAAEQLALDVIANAFCRVAVPALLAPLELIEDLIPIVGWIATAAEVAATPALIRLCVKGIEKEGKAEFKVFGKKQSLSLDTRTKPVSTRPPRSSHNSMPTSTANCKRADGDNCGRPRRTGPPIYEETASTTIEPAPTVSVCDGSRWQQPCLHYSSVIQRMPTYKTLKCPVTSYAHPNRPWRDQWYDDHSADWYNGFMQQRDVRCEADEYPPAAFHQGDRWPKQYIRFSPGSQNGGAGSLFHLDFCGFDAQGKLPVERANERYVSDRTVGGLKRRVTQYMGRTTRRAVRIDFINVVDPDGEAGLISNPCWPSILLYDPGFALLTDDPYYARHRSAQQYGIANYPDLIPLDVLGNHQPQQGYRKRDEKLHGLDPEAWVFDDGNTTRRATADELVRDMGILRCNSADCHEEMQELEIDSALIVQSSDTSYHPVVPTTFASRTQSVPQTTATAVTRGAFAKIGADRLLATPTKMGL
ncbi:glycosyl hydrolases family 18-domain-containing protein [Xylaria scruposa]|nr:glycosyl hydrolases family 18-domain-containing protein [Xylaria scruposa]